MHDLAQSTGHLSGPTVAPPWRLLQDLVQDPVHSPGQVTVEAAGRQMPLVHYLVEGGMGIAPAEGQSPRQHLIQHHAQTPDVGAFIHLLTLALLRTYVLRSTHQSARHGHGGLVGGLGDAEVGQLGLT